MSESIAIIGNVASLGYLIGRELETRGYKIDYYCTNNIFTTMPNPKHTTRIDKSYNLPFARTIKRLWQQAKKSYDLEIRLSATRYARAKNSVIIYNGSELRDGVFKPEPRCFITTRDLFLYTSSCDARFLPRCIDTKVFVKKRRKAWKEDEPLIVGHFPTQADIKGTSMVLKAIEQLQSKGIKCELYSKIVPHDEMPSYLSKIHILCDQFVLNCYGIIAIEALASGVPVVCTVREDYYDFSEMKNQIVNCQPTVESIAQAILDATKKEIEPDKVAQLHSPQHTVDVLFDQLEKWLML